MEISLFSSTVAGAEFISRAPSRDGAPAGTTGTHIWVFLGYPPGQMLFWDTDSKPMDTAKPHMLQARSVWSISCSLAAFCPPRDLAMLVPVRAAPKAPHPAKALPSTQILKKANKPRGTAREGLVQGHQLCHAWICPIYRQLKLSPSS